MLTNLTLHTIIRPVGRITASWVFGANRKIRLSGSLFGITRRSLVMPNSDPRTDFSIRTSHPWKILIISSVCCNDHYIFGIIARPDRGLLRIEKKNPLRGRVSNNLDSPQFLLEKKLSFLHLIKSLNLYEVSQEVARQVFLLNSSPTEESIAWPNG